ncbi:MAG: hypothetical protein ACI9MR_000221 [Myxococcota bacterium]|jgi:hypothetical protein
MTHANTHLGRPLRRIALVVAVIAGLAACEDTPNTDPDTAADTTSDTGGDADSTDTIETTTGPQDTTTVVTPVYGTPCADAARVGTFQVGRWQRYSAVTGEVTNGVIPLTVRQEIGRDGDCRLLRKQNPFCNPACANGDLCDHDGQCIPYPENQSVGTITVSGLNALVEMMPNPVQSYAAVDVPLALFDTDAEITLSAAGDALAGFTMAAFGVPPLVAPEETLDLARDRPLVVEWTAEPGAWHIVFSVNIDQHGSSPVTLVCDVADSGRHTVSATLINAFLDAGVSGFASFDLVRRTVSSTTVDAFNADANCIELQVLSQADGRLTVNGHIACTRPQDCPPELVCDRAVNTCVTP